MINNPASIRPRSVPGKDKRTWTYPPHICLVEKPPDIDYLAVSLPHGTSRISCGNISLYVSESEKEINFGAPSRSRNFFPEGTEEQLWTEYEIYPGFDVWEVASLIFRSSTLPSGIEEEDLPVSCAFRKIYPMGFTPICRCTPADAHKYACKDLEKILALGPLDAEIRLRLEDLIHYLWNYITVERTFEQLPQVLNIGRCPPTE